MTRYLVFLLVLIWFTGCSDSESSTDAPAAKPNPPNPAPRTEELNIIGTWNLDKEASLKATEENTAGGPVDEAQRERMKANYRAELDGAEYIRVEIRDDGKLAVVKLVKGTSEPQREEIPYTIASKTDNTVVVKMNDQVDYKIIFLTPDRIQTDSAGGVLIQISDRMN